MKESEEEVRICREQKDHYWISLAKIILWKWVVGVAQLVDSVASDNRDPRIKSSDLQRIILSAVLPKYVLNRQK